MNFLLNGQANGDVATTLMAHNFDPNALRPWIGKRGGSLMTINGKNYTANANATLRKDEWIQLDTAVIKAAKQRLNAVADLRSKGLQYNIPAGMGKTTLEHETQSDVDPAIISMDGIRQGDADRPVYELKSLPLPIIHKDFFYTARQLAASRNGGSPLDTTTAELAARRVAEEAEKLLLGESSTYSYGGGTIYGYKNFPDRLTKSMTAPTPTNHETTVSEVLDMVKQAQDNGYYGSYTLYYSSAWFAAINEDYSQAKGDNTLKDRLMKIDGITEVKQADYLSGNDMILVQMTSDVTREVVGMDITTVQWESKGGMQLNYKVMAILVPQLRTDHYGKTGIVHGTF